MAKTVAQQRLHKPQPSAVGRARGELAVTDKTARAAPSAAAIKAGRGSIATSLMRAIIAASEALTSYLESRDAHDSAAVELDRPGSELAERVRKYQLASRHFLGDWRRDMHRSAWLVDSASGRTLDVLESGTRAGIALAPQTKASLAEDQALQGLRTRCVRAGIGIPLTVWTPPKESVVDLDSLSAARPLTAIVTVEPAKRRSARIVRVALMDPVAAASTCVGATSLPLAADFTAPLAHTLAAQRKPAATPYRLRDSTRRATVDGFTALTPYAEERTPLILLEAVGFSPLMMAQVANAVAGDEDLRRRYQVWLYSYPAVAPIFYAASRFRTDLEAFCTRLRAIASRTTARRAVLVAQGPAAVIAKTLLVDSGATFWDAVFRTGLDKLVLSPLDRAVLQQLFFWKRSERVGRIVVASEPQNAAALTRGVDQRAVQLLLRQPVEYRRVVERIYGAQKQYLRGRSNDSRSAGAQPDAEVAPFADPVRQAVADAALACEQALLAMLGARAASDIGLAVHSPASGLVPLAGHLQGSRGTLDPDIVGLIAAALRTRHFRNRSLAGADRSPLERLTAGNATPA
jgi:hypothetical protein